MDIVEVCVNHCVHLEHSAFFIPTAKSFGSLNNVRAAWGKKLGGREVSLPFFLRRDSHHGPESSVIGGFNSPSILCIVRPKQLNLSLMLSEKSHSHCTCFSSQLQFRQSH